MPKKRPSQDILIFTPNTPDIESDIVKIGREVLNEMRERGLEAEIRFSKFWIEVEHGTTLEEIIDAYNEGLELSGQKNKIGRKPGKPGPDLII